MHIHIYIYITIEISVSPPFQLATKPPVLVSNNEMVPVEYPTAMSVSDLLTAIVRTVPIVSDALVFHVCNTQ